MVYNLALARQDALNAARRGVRNAANGGGVDPNAQLMTLDLISAANVTLSEADQTMTSAGGGANFKYACAAAAFARRRNDGGKYYFETRQDTNAQFNCVTLWDSTGYATPSTLYASEQNGGGMLSADALIRAYAHNVNYYNYVTVTSSDANRWEVGEYIAMCIDFDNDELSFYVDGVLQDDGPHACAFVDDVDYLPVIKPYNEGIAGFSPVVQFPIAGFTIWG